MATSPAMIPIILSMFVFLSIQGNSAGSGYRIFGSPVPRTYDGPLDPTRLIRLFDSVRDSVWLAAAAGDRQ
jgi:hypothetical protein